MSKAGVANCTASIVVDALPDGGPRASPEKGADKINGLPACLAVKSGYGYR